VSNSQNALIRCAGVQRFADAYLDGEFAETDRLELEAHLATCEACRNKIKVQADWKKAIKDAAPREKAPAALRNRVQRAVGGEARRARRPAWRQFVTRVLPVAAAGGLLATFMITRGGLPVAADVVAKHQRNLPIEVSGGAEQLKRWYSDKVDFPVRPLNMPKASLRGGRLANIRDRQAAYLVYDYAGGNKVSVFVFDPSNIELFARRKAMVGQREVYLDEERGYNVAVFRDRGVGYAIASDLAENEVLNLVSHAVPQP
jgi:mycothiol system anti-sigma-R factor